MSRWVVVDDTDPAVTYTGPWFQDNGTLNNLGNYGQPHLNTLHGTYSNASFSYTFHGSIVRVTGTNQWINPAGVVNPSWQCIVDGVTLPATTLSPAMPENRVLYCEKDGLSDGPHLITVNAIVSNQTFWFDYIQYLPTASALLDHASFFVEAGNSQFQYGTGWSSFSPGNKTGQNGSTFTFEFNGTFFTWLGFYDNSLPYAATTATYAIDGKSPITFDLDGASAVDTGVQYNQVFFHSGQLSPGMHTLDVVYLGNPQTAAPLTLYELYFENFVSSSSSSVTSTGSSTGTSTGISNSNLDTTNHSSNLGPIVGGVIGGLALIIFSVVAILFFRRRNNRPPGETASVNPFLGHSTVALSPLTHHSSSNNFYSNPQARDLSDFENTNNPNSTTSLSPLSPNRGVLPTRMIQVDTAAPLGTPTRLREQRKGEESISHAQPQFQLETRTSAPRLSPSSLPGNSSQPARLVHDEDAGIQLAPTDQHGNVVALLPPVYSF